MIRRNSSSWLWCDRLTVFLPSGMQAPQDRLVPGAHVEAQEFQALQAHKVYLHTIGMKSLLC